MNVKLLFLIFTLNLASGFNGADERARVRGRVTDGHQALAGVQITVKGASGSARSDSNGKYEIEIQGRDAVLQFSLAGYQTKDVPVRGRSEINVVLTPKQPVNREVLTKKPPVAGRITFGVAPQEDRSYPYPPVHHTEDYSPINESGFRDVLNRPLSTFSIDVDAASYSNVRRFLEQGMLPPVDAVRIEELINYFDYDYPQPTGNDPVRLITEIAGAPWNSDNRLVHIAVQGKSIPAEALPASNLVFLIDVSGSMQAPNKLPLLQRAFKLLVAQLRAKDRVAIVTYAGQSRVAMNSTPGDRKEELIGAIDALQAGGSTAGGAGIQEAYRMARAHFIKGGNNRVILATDGDFNVGISSDGELQRLIEKERESGIFLSVLGFGMGNYKDNKLELLADKGNGNYAYIDTFREARKVLGEEFGGTLFTIAKDVKLQVEFNPRYVKSYRLIGYENRMLNEEDFKDDKKDAGEMGSGHTVTALYEIVPAGAGGAPAIPLKYQNRTASGAAARNEVLTVRLRYKNPDGAESKELEAVLRDSGTDPGKASENFRLAASVAGFGMLLRNSEYRGNVSYDQLIRLARGAKGKDRQGYRAEFLNLLETAKALSAVYSNETD
ncbi:MAG: von Willebrand factor type A domain-containing protein [Solitalea sp.]